MVNSQQILKTLLINQLAESIVGVGNYYDNHLLVKVICVLT